MTRTPLIHILIAALVLIGVSGAYAAWFMAVQRESEHARTLAGEVQNKQQDSDRVASAKAAIAGLSDDEASIGAHFVPTTNVVPFLEQLEATGAARGAKVQVVSVSSAIVSTRGKLNLAVSITGSFDAVARTLGAFEYSPYDMSLSNLTLDSSPSADGAHEWSAEATFSVGTGTIATTTASAPVAVPTPTTI